MGNAVMHRVVTVDTSPTDWGAVLRGMNCEQGVVNSPVHSFTQNFLELYMALLSKTFPVVSEVTFMFWCTPTTSQGLCAPAAPAPRDPEVSETGGVHAPATGGSMLVRIVSPSQGYQNDLGSNCWQKER